MKRVDRIVFVIFLAIIGIYSLLMADGMLTTQNTLIITGEKAQLKVTPASGIDSFIYVDTINGSTAKWVSPLQIIRLTPSISTDTFTYICSLSFAAQVLGVNVLCPADSGLTWLVDTLTKEINGTTNLTDTVIAEDSLTYVKIISMFSQLTLTARWSMVLGDSLDTASTVTTVAMLIDSIIPAIQTNSYLDSAAYYQDFTTYYMINWNDPGVIITITTDTVQDVFDTVVYGQNRRIIDTIPISNGLNVDAIQGVIRIDSGAFGTGVADTMIMVLRAELGPTSYLIDSVLNEGHACTMAVHAWDDSIFIGPINLYVTWADSHFVGYDTTATSIINTWLKFYEDKD